MIRMTYRGLDEAIKKLDPKIIKISTAVALRKAAVGGRKVIAKELRTLYNLKSAQIKDQISISKLEAQRVKLLAKTRRIPLIEFKPTQGKVGIRVKILKSSGRQIIPHTFIATVKSRQVFERERSGSKRAARHPLVPLQGPSIYTLARGRKIFTKAEAYVKQQFRKNLIHEINYRMGKKLGTPFDLMVDSEQE